MSTMSTGIWTWVMRINWCGYCFGYGTIKYKKDADCKTTELKDGDCIKEDGSKEPLWKRL